MQNIVSSSLTTLKKVSDDINKSVVELLNYNFSLIFPNWSIVEKQKLVTKSYEIYYYSIKLNNSSDTIEVKYERWAFKKSFKGQINIILNNDYAARTMKLPEKVIICDRQIVFDEIGIYLDPEDIFLTTVNNEEEDRTELRFKSKEICEYIMQLIFNECL